MAETSIDLGLTALDELFMTDEGRRENRLPRVQPIPLKEIDDMTNHPFPIRMEDDDMLELIESVKAHGVLTPAILRKKEDGRYECVSGHRRRAAAAKAGLDSIPAEVRDITHDEAIIIMAHSNRQRSKVFPSEKAFAYKMEMEALKRQGKRTDLTFGPMGQKLNSREEVAEQSGDSSRQIHRYIRLTYLIPPLLDLVDAGRIALHPAEALSYLKINEQQDLYQTITIEDATPSLKQANTMKEHSEAGTLTPDVILSIMVQKKPNQKDKITFHVDRLRPYLPKGIPQSHVEQYILKALEYYQLAIKRSRGQER